MMESENDSQWELSKENVQPLRQGRQMNSLQVALTPNADSLHEELRRQQTNYELQLRTYSGPDPISVWYEYIEWIEQNFTTRGPDGKWFKVVHKCCIEFHNDSRFTNDERLLQIWMKLISSVDEPLEIYNHMYTSNLFTELATFYVNWALELENVGDKKRADEIYNKGIDRRAQPLDFLKLSYKKFVARISTTPVDDDSNEIEDGEGQREALAALQTKGKKKSVANERVMNRESQARFFLNQIPHTNSQSNKGFQFYEDDKNNSTAAQSQVESELNLLKISEVGKENRQIPGKWNEAKMKQTSVKTIPISAANQQVSLNYTVYEDPQEEKSQIGIQKHTEDWRFALGEKKPENHSVLPVPVADNPSICIMYCKDKLYAGGQELSFEELRVARWFERQKTSGP